MASLLIYTATIGDEMRPETRASIEAQETSILFDWEIGRHNPFPGNKNANVVAQYQRAREMCLAGDYEALLTVEHDMIIPPDTVQKLYETDAPVVYGIYLLRHGTPTLNAWRYENGRNMGMSLSLYPAELRKYKKQGWAEVSGTGWGCTLIRRNVLERLTVHSNSGTDAGDLTFSTECLRAKIKQIARFDVPCGHVLSSGTILNPYRNGGLVSRVIALTTINALIGGRSTPLKKGRYYTISPNEAAELQRAGYVQVTNDVDVDLDEEEERETATVEPVAEKAVAPKTKTRATRAKKAK